MKKIISLILVPALMACTSVNYSFTGVDTGGAQSVSIEYFPNNAALIQPQLSQMFTETLRDIFVQQTSLALRERDGDLHFSGAIVDYRIEPINAQASDIGTAAQNRLTVVVNVIFTNKLEPKNSYEKRFSRFADFDAEADLNQVEVELLDQISEELSENILNDAIGNW